MLKNFGEIQWQIWPIAF